MTVKSKRGKGLQRRGRTQIDADLVIDKAPNGGTVIRISSGTFIDVDGTKYSVEGAEKDIGTSSNDRKIGIWLHQADADNALEVHIGEQAPGNIVQRIVPSGWFQVPANTSDLSTVDMYAYGWIDEHPANVMDHVRSQGGEAVNHADLMALKQDGVELELKNVGNVIQKPSADSTSQQVNVV